MGQESTIGYDFVNSVKPRLFIPTHLWFEEVATQKVVDTWPSFYTQAESMHFDAANRHDETTALLSGVNAMFYPVSMGVPLYQG